MFRSIAVVALLAGAAAPVSVGVAEGAAAGGAAAAGVLAADPPVFSRDGLNEDRKRAIDENRVHVVYATATWCGPCKKMKATTWVDRSVVEWLEANAVVTPLDVDASQSEARRLRIRAMPTTMVFRGSTEIARTVGYKDASAFRGWLESSTGRAVPAEGERGAPASRASVQDKMIQARDAVRAERFDEAAETYAWLWDNMRQDRAADELRRGGLSEQIASLIETHGGAREPFAVRRNAIGSRMPALDADDERLLDWIALNRVLGEPELTAAWMGRSVGDRSALAFMRKHQRLLRPVLTEADQWRDAAAVVNNPFAAARLELMELKKAQRRSGGEGLDDPTLAALADLYAIGHVIDRGGYADRIASLVLRTEDTPEVRRALVSRAIDAGYTKPTLAELIENDGSDEAQALRAELDR